MKKLESIAIHNIGVYYYSGIYSGYTIFNDIMLHPFGGDIPLRNIHLMKI